MTLKQQLIIYLFIFFFNHFLGSCLFCDGVRTWRWSHDAHPRRSIHRATNHVLLWLCHPRSPILARPRNCVQGLEVGQLAARRRGLRQNRRFRAMQRGHGFRTADWNFLRDAWVPCTWGMSFLIFFFLRLDFDLLSFYFDFLGWLTLPLDVLVVEGELSYRRKCWIFILLLKIR